MKIQLLLSCCLIRMIQTQLVYSVRYFQGKDFNDYEGWTVQGNVGKDLFSSCDKVKIFGGDQRLGTKAIAINNIKLPPHHTLNLKLQFWKMDTWEEHEKAYIWVDHEIVWQKNFKWNGGQPMCTRHKGEDGATWEVVNVDVTFKHTGATAIVVITTDLDEDADKESWGFRDFELSATLCPENCQVCDQNDTYDDCFIWNEQLVQKNISEFQCLSCWDLTEGVNNLTNCGGVELFGGYKLFSERTELKLKSDFKLAPHYKVKVKALIATIDGDFFGKIETDVIPPIQIQNNNQRYAVSACGNNLLDRFERIEGDFEHNSQQLSLKLQSDGVWGIRDLQLFVAKCAANCIDCEGPKTTDCYHCEHDFDPQNNECYKLLLFDSEFNDYDSMNQQEEWKFEGGLYTWGRFRNGNRDYLGGRTLTGSGASVRRTFKIPPHYRLGLHILFSIMGLWENEWILVQVDGVVVVRKQFNYQPNQNWHSHVKGIFLHQAQETTILLTSTLKTLPRQGTKHTYDSFWGFREFKLYYEPIYPQCAVFFTQYEFKGKSYEFCGHSANFSKDKLPRKIRSIKVPPQGKVTLYQSSDYHGKKVVFTSDQPYINEHEVQIVQFQISLLEAAHVESEEWIEVPLNGQVE